MAANIKVVPTCDYHAVIETVDKYVEGLRVGSVQVCAEAFHTEATIYGLNKPPTSDGMMAGPISLLYDVLEKLGGSPNMKTRSDILAMTQTTAVVRVDMEGGAPELNFTDLLTLIKIDGTWQVIIKVFHKYDK